MISKKYARKAFTFMKSNNKFIDLENEQMTKELATLNNPLLYYLYLKRNMKEEAIDVLKLEITSKYKIINIQQCIYTFLYFKDFDGALKLIKIYKDQIPSISALECLIKIAMLDKIDDCSDNTVFSYVIKGLLAYFDRRLIEALKDFYKNTCKNCLNNCLKTKFTKIQEIIMSNYYDKLNYKNARYLYKMMPEKLPFLKKMIECNPFIKKKYYFKYANIYGIRKEDILRILRAKYRPWALEIAMMYGWIDESIKLTLERDLWGIPILINEKYGSDVDLNSIMTFSKKQLYNSEENKK